MFLAKMHYFQGRLSEVFLRFGLRFVYPIKPLVNCQLEESFISNTADNYDSFCVHI